MRLAINGSEPGRLPRWVVVMTAVVVTLVLSQLISSSSHLSTSHRIGQSNSTRVSWSLGGHTLQMEVHTAGAAEPDSPAMAARETSKGLAGTEEEAAVVKKAADAPAAESASAQSEEEVQAAAGESAAVTAEAGGEGPGDAPKQGSGALQPAGDSQTQRVQLPQGTFTCKTSGYCSLGKTKTWRGDVGTNAKLREMLEATSYKKEIILLFINNAKGLWGQMTYNMIMSIEDLGFGHLVLLTDSENTCTGLLPRFNHISCAWATRQASGGTSGTQGLWEQKWETVARILRMQYNLLLMDADAMLHHDPYVFLKSGPLSKYNLLFQTDGPDGHQAINCGVMYWQNVHPSGPSVWTAVEHADRTLRQREGEAHMKTVYSKWDRGYTWEQTVWWDMLLSVDVGLPQFTTVQPIGTDEWMEKLGGFRHMRKYTCEWTPFPPKWNNVTGRAEIWLCGALNVTVPTPNATWWEERVHLFYPKERGQLAQAFIELVRDASSFPLAEAGLPFNLPEGMPTEHVGFLPNFFATGFIFRGVHYFGASQPPPQVVSHAVHITTDTGDWKVFVFKGNNWWHWEIQEEMDGEGNVLGMNDPRLLMLAPGVHLLTDTERSFRDEVKKLVALAHATGRRLVLPPPPCDSPWIGILEEPQAVQEKWPNLIAKWKHTYDPAQALQFPDRQRPGHSLCQWNRFLLPHCIAKLPAHVVAVAFLERSLSREQATPSADNTLWFKEWHGTGGIETEVGKSAVVATTMADVAKAAERFAASQVLFLGALPRLEGVVPEPPEEIMRACYMLQEAYEFRADKHMQKTRQALLNATAAAKQQR